MLDDYLKAALPDRWIILGQQLEPFSLGHVMILARLGNSFVTGEPPQAADLIQAVFICCHRYEEALTELQRADLPELLRKWGEAIGDFDVPTKIEEFKGYIAAGSTWPELNDPPEDKKQGREPGSPFLQRVKLTLLSKLNHSLSEALNKPYGEAIHDYFAFAEMQGSAEITTAKEKTDIEETLAEHQEILKQMEAQDGVQPSNNP